MDWNPAIGKYSTIYPAYNFNNEKIALCKL